VHLIIHNLKRKKMQKERPDWENSPTWARFYAVDPDGRSFWFENTPKPTFDLFEDGSNIEGWFSERIENRVGKFEHCGYCSFEDWTKTLQIRPTQAVQPAKGMIGLSMQPEFFKVAKGRNMHTGWPDSGF
jgi:hypothetical protein